VNVIVAEGTPARRTSGLEPTNWRLLVRRVKPLVPPIRGWLSFAGRRASPSRPRARESTGPLGPVFLRLARPALTASSPQVSRQHH